MDSHVLAQIKARAEALASKAEWSTDDCLCHFEYGQSAADALALLAEVARLQMTLEAAQAALRDAIASNTAWADDAINYRELLESCWAHLDPYLLEDGTPHPGERSIIHELFERLWPERVKK